MKQPNWVLIAAILASSMAFIDGSALNVAIPALQKSFNASGSDILWILNGYLLMLGAFILPGGALGDQLGRKRIFMIGIGLFLVASFACALSSSVQMLVVLRLLQGLGGALMIPGSLSLISATTTDAERGKSIGTWSAASTLVTICGPVLGGVLADAHFWQGVFLINIPLGIAALLILIFKVPESRNEARIGKIDILGAVALALGLGCLSYGILKVPALGFYGIETGGAIGAGLLILLFFIGYESRCKNPMLPLNLFQSATFSGSNLLTLFLYGALSAGLFFQSLNLIQIQGYSQTVAGFTTLPFAILLTLFSRKMGALSDRLGARRFLIMGPLLAGLGFYLLSLPGLTHGASDYWVTYFPGIITLGIGMTLTVAPLTTTVLASVDRNYSGTASGVNNAVSRIAGVLAIAVVGAMALSLFQQNLMLAIQRLPLTAAMHQTLQVESAKLGNTRPSRSLPVLVQREIQDAINVSFIETYRRVMELCAAFAVLSALMAALLVHSSLAVSDKKLSS